MSQDYGLGRGLSSLIPKKNTTSKKDEPVSLKTPITGKNPALENSVREVEVGLIISNPHQPRTEFNREKLSELAKSLKTHGIIQPLIVSKKDDKFELIAGERRFMAAKEAGLTTVPIVIRNAKEKEKLELAIVENVHRHDLNAIEEAKAYQKLIEDFQMNQEEVAEKMGKSRSAVANKVRLINLPVEIQKALIEERISEGHAKAILALENKEKQRALYELILKNKLTVRQAEDKTRQISVKSHKRTISTDPQTREIEDKLTGLLGTKVKIKKSAAGGKIVIDYYSNEELNEMVNRLNGTEN